VATRRLQAGGIDVANALQMIGICGADPTFRRGPGMFAKAVLTPSGPGTMRLTWTGPGDLTAEAWGPAPTGCSTGRPAGSASPTTCWDSIRRSTGVVARLSSTDLHRMNVERRRADAILLAAKRANRMGRLRRCRSTLRSSGCRHCPVSGCGRRPPPCSPPTGSRHGSAARPRHADEGQLRVHR